MSGQMLNLLKPTIIKDTLPVLLRHDKTFISSVTQGSKLLTYCQLKHFSSNCSTSGINHSGIKSGESNKATKNIAHDVDTTANINTAVEGTAHCKDTAVDDSVDHGKEKQTEATEVGRDKDPGFKAALSALTDNYSDDEDPGFKAALSAVTPNMPPPIHVDIVPGKGPPPAPPVDCCMSGCANCVWIQYAEELKDYFTAGEGNIRAKEAIEKIDNPGLQMFLKLELGLL